MKDNRAVVLEMLEPRRLLAAADTTAAGAELVKDINPGIESSIAATVIPRAVFSFRAGDLVYFNASHATLGEGLWRSDGTAEGTQYLAPVLNVRHRAQLGGVTIFWGQTADGTGGLWRTDGTAAGTRLLTPGRKVWTFSKTAVLGDELYFAAEIELWKTDGTEAGTAKLTDVPYGVMSMGGYGDKLVLEMEGRPYAIDVTMPDPVPTPLREHYGFWVKNQSITSTPLGVFFVASFDWRGDLLWVTDGTPAGTRALGSADGTLYTAREVVAHVGDKVFFTASSLNRGQEIWVTDGTDEGTHLVRDIATGSASIGFTEYWPDHLPGISVAGDHLVMTLLMPGLQRQVWRTDGTRAGTFKLPIPHGSVALDGGPFGAAAHGTYFWSGDGVWFTDGTVEGTSQLDLRVPWANPTSPHGMGTVGNSLLFTADGTIVGREVWKVTAPLSKAFTGTVGDDHWTIGNVGDYRLGVWSGGRGQDVPPDAEFAGENLSRLTFTGLGGDDTLTIAGGVEVPVEFVGGDGTDGIVVSGGGHAGGSGSWETLDVRGGTFTVDADLALQQVSIQSDGSVTLAPGGNVTLRTGLLTLGGQDDLDVNDNTLVVEGGDLAAVEAFVARGRNSGTIRWGGDGIRSGAAAAGAAGNASMGLAATRIGGDVIVKYTYDGDANLDGKVNADDYFKIDSGFAVQPASPQFADGDFDYDGKINADDYFLIDSAFLTQPLPRAAQRTQALTDEHDLSLDRARKRQRRPHVRESAKQLPPATSRT